MGNQLAGIAPAQILSVDSYFSDIHDHEYDKSLGSTRFFKVARAKHREGLVVVKVFAIQDPSLPLTSYKQELEELRSDYTRARTACLSRRPPSLRKQPSSSASTSGTTCMIASARDPSSTMWRSAG